MAGTRTESSRLDRQGEYAARVKRLAVQADGADGRWNAADARRFLHSVGREIDLVERAIRETVLGGVIMRGHQVLGAFAQHTGHRPAAPTVLPAAGVEGLTNGRVPPSRLSDVGDGERMTKVAAAQFRAMDAAAMAVGLDLHVNSGYRTYAEQAALYDGYLHHGGPLAAAPGHSTHGLGLSADIDVRDARVFGWLEHHAHEYGFVRDVPSERWHWTYRPR
jgi:hypothetical protein